MKSERFFQPTPKKDPISEAFILENTRLSDSISSTYQNNKRSPKGQKNAPSGFCLLEKLNHRLNTIQETFYCIDERFKLLCVQTGQTKSKVMKAMTIYLGENIKRLRAEKGVTQETLAEFLGVTFQSVSRWERGEGFPDITLLPSIASFFGTSVDDLLGTGKAKKEEEIRKYLEIYDTMKLKDLSYTSEVFRKAVKDFPDDFRILVRYMNLLEEEKDKPYSEDYEKTSKELLGIYERIESHCTDDGIRIWAKRIIISHLLKKYQCTCNEEGRYYVHKEYFEKAKEIINTLPNMSDSKELMLVGTAENSEEYYEAQKKLSEELIYLLSEASFGYFSESKAEDRIKVSESLQSLLELIYKNGSYGKNCYNRLYNFGNLGHLYHTAGDDERALFNLRKAAEYAIELESTPEEAERYIRYYNFGPPYRDLSPTQFMKTVMTEHYPLTEEFKEREEFKEIVRRLG